MDYGIGMFLAGLGSGVAIGWFVGVVKIHLAYGNPEDLKRELMLYKGLLYKAGLSVDGDPGVLRLNPKHDPAPAGLFVR